MCPTYLVQGEMDTVKWGTQNGLSTQDRDSANGGASEDGDRQTWVAPAVIHEIASITYGSIP